jgi:hypothetical protein
LCCDVLPIYARRSRMKEFPEEGMDFEVFRSCVFR